MLLIKVGLIEKNFIFQVLDIPIAHNLLLGQPWIHDMQVVLSTYHQCIKFPFNGIEVIFHGDKSMSINMLSIVETLLHNLSSHKLQPSFTECE